jgi:hypothetical protein
LAGQKNLAGQKKRPEVEISHPAMPKALAVKNDITLDDIPVGVENSATHRASMVFTAVFFMYSYETAKRKVLCSYFVLPLSLFFRLTGNRINCAQTLRVSSRLSLRLLYPVHDNPVRTKLYRLYMHAQYVTASAGQPKDIRNQVQVSQIHAMPVRSCFI